MITLLVIGIIILAVKMVLFSLKAAWGLAKILTFVILLPVILLAMLIIGLLHAVIPILLIALLLSFLIPKLRGA
ncbi:MAG: hypothetical protein SOT70_03700 [Lachnospiraceae bacterium]|nr:hypothetical protein [Lachnospiraceae bacterium]